MIKELVMKIIAFRICAVLFAISVANGGTFFYRSLCEAKEKNICFLRKSDIEKYFKQSNSDNDARVFWRTNEGSIKRCEYFCWDAETRKVLIPPECGILKEPLAQKLENYYILNI